MEADSGIKLGMLKVDGGASANDFLMQTQADIINRQVARPECVESTAKGAAYLAGLAVGFWESEEDIKRHNRTDRVFEPKIEEEERRKRIEGWQRAIRTASFWAEEG